MNEITEAMGCMYYMATIHLSSENYDEALKYFSMIYQLNPESPKLLQAMGDIYIKKKKYNKALEIFAQLKQMEPEDMSSYIRSGLIYFEMKDFDKAVVEFEFVLQKYPDSDRINYFMGVLYADKKNHDKAFSYFDRIGESSLFFFEALNRQIYILREQDKISEAVDLLENKIAKKSDSPDIVGLKVSLLLYAENYKRALAVISQGVSRFKDDDRLLFQRAVIYDKLGQWYQAKQDLHALIAMNPESEHVYNYLGYTMLERGENIDEAIKYITKAMTLKPNDGHIIDSLGWGHFKKGDYDKALELLLKAYQYQPQEPAILEHLGDVYFAMKNKRAARYYYEKALHLLNKISKKTDDDRKILKSVEDKLAQF
jgi:tetratricopeptide (TPR) repeat protein